MDDNYYNNYYNKLNSIIKLEEKISPLERIFSLI